MGDGKNGKVELPAAEFMAKHAPELAESEQKVSMKLFASMFPEGQISLASLTTPNPKLDAWLQAREGLPGYRLMSELKRYWLVPLLKIATKENSPEAYRELLEGWLIRLGVEPPPGVFLISRRGRGAPRKASTEQIYQIWFQNQQPAWGELAYDVYGADYTRADSKLRKKLRDRCMRAVRRFEAMLRDQKVIN
jgi:hypothetical protein